MSFVAVAGCYGDFGSVVEGSAVHGECASCFEINDDSVVLERPPTALHQCHSFWRVSDHLITVRNNLGKQVARV